MFIANGEVQRSKGDQISSEVCTGKALQDGNLKMKTYNPENVYVVNHENNSIYNDVAHFLATNMQEALANYAQYASTDATILVRGSDGLILR